MPSPLDRLSTAPSRFGRARRLLGLLAASLLCLYAILPAQASPAVPSLPRSHKAAAAVPGIALARLPDSPGFEYVGGFGGAVETVAISDTLAYIGQGPQFAVIDFGHPAPRAPIATLPLTTTLVDVQVLGSRAYLVGRQLDLLILDVADPGHPVPLGSFDTPGVTEQVLVIGTRAYFAAGTQGLQILDVADPANPTLLGSYATQGAAVDVDVIGNRAYVVDTVTGLVILDIGTPAVPVKLGTYAPSVPEDDGKRVQVVGSRAYFLTTYGLLILDAGYDFANAVEVVDDIAFVTTGGWRDGGLRILDVSDPDAPTLVSLTPMTSAAGVRANGNHA